MKKLLFAAAISSGVVAGNAAILFNSGAAAAQGYLSQDMEHTYFGATPDGSGGFLDSVTGDPLTDDPTGDNPALSTWCFDDFTVPVGHIWNITQALARGEETGPNASRNDGVHMKVTATQNHNGVALVQANNASNGGQWDSTNSVSNYVGATGESGGNITMAMSGSLVSGTYYLHAWVSRVFSLAGQWNWKTTNAAITGDAGGGWGQGGLVAGGGPSHFLAAGGPANSDLSFQINGTDTVVPEPATLLAIGVGLAALAARRVRK